MLSHLCILRLNLYIYVSHLKHSQRSENLKGEMGRDFQKREAVLVTKKAKRGIMAHQVLNGGLQSWVKEKPQGVLSNKTFWKIVWRTVCCCSFLKYKQICIFKPLKRYNGQQTMPLLDTRGWWIKSPVPRICDLFGVVGYYGSIDLQTFQIISISLDCPPELDSKTLLLKTSHILVTEHR